MNYKLKSVPVNAKGRTEEQVRQAAFRLAKRCEKFWGAPFVVELTAEGWRVSALEMPSQGVLV